MEIISTARKQTDLADQIVHRTYEVYQYDLNITNYEAMLANLPTDEWPTNIAHLQGMPAHAAAAQCDPEYVDVLSQYQLRDHVATTIKSERVERAKAAATLEVVDTQLSGPGRDAALQAAIARREAAQSQ